MILYVRTWVGLGLLTSESEKTLKRISVGSNSMITRLGDIHSNPSQVGMSLPPHAIYSTFSLT